MRGTTQPTSMEQCIQNCQNCHALCEQTLHYCLQQGGPHTKASHIQALIDCIQGCYISTSFLLRESQFYAKACALCVITCNQCAESCEHIVRNDLQMNACAEMCRRCAASCQIMAKTA